MSLKIEGINYADLQTRKNFYDYVQLDIRENIWDITDGELEITNKYCILLDFFQSLHILLPKSKKNLATIVFGASQNFVKCLRYILIPDNNAAFLTLRVLSENLIILKFLLQNDASYTEKWSKWLNVFLSFDGQLGDFDRLKASLLSELRKEYDEIDGNKIGFDQLTRNQYGWAFPKVKSFLNLQRIAECCDEGDTYARFCRLSFDVHSNSVVQNNQSRMEHNTYRIVSNAAQLMDGYLAVLLRYVGAKQTNAKRFLTVYDDLIGKTKEYLSRCFALAKTFL